MKRFAALLALLSLAPFAGAQTTFDLDRTIAPFPPFPSLLTEGFPGPPVVAFPPAALGLVGGDEVDALSFGDDFDIQTFHHLVFSVDIATAGMPGTGTANEFAVDTAPGMPPAAAGDIFFQELLFTPGNILAPPGLGYAAGTFTGDEANATWAGACPAVGACEDLDAFDYSPPAVATGVYFSLRPGSPTLGLIGAGPGDVLYSDLTGVPPVVATLAGAGPATAANLGIPGLDLDALNVVGTTGPILAGGGVILPGPVGPSIAGAPPIPSTHLLQYSVAIGTGFDADVLQRSGAGFFTVHTPAPGVGLFPFENLNALEAAQPPSGCPPLQATATAYNGIGINLDRLDATPVIVGGAWTATLTPQPTRGPGAWVILLRTTSSAGPVLDLGLFFALPPAGLSELLVGPGVIATFGGPPHGGGGTSTSFSASVPFNCALVGMPWFAQAIVTGDLPAGAGVLDPWFSTAMRGVIGTF